MPKKNKLPGHSNLCLRPGFESIYLYGTYPGVGEILRSTGETDIKRAVKVAKELEAQIYKIDPSYEPRKIREIAELILEINEDGWAKGTLEGATNIIRNHIIPEFGRLDLSDFKEEIWSGYTKRFYAKNPTGRLFNKRKYMTKILNFAFKKGYLKEKFELPINDQPKRRGKVISDLDLEKIIANTTSKTLPLQIYFGRYMGIRKDEILGIEIEEIDLARLTLNLGKPSTSTKNHKRSMAIAPEVVPLLKSQMSRVSGALLFPSETGEGYQQDNHATWDRACKNEKGEYWIEVNFHDLRHTFITVKLLDEQKPILHVSEYVGTSVSELQKTYTHHIAEQTRHLVELVETKKAVGK